MSRRLSSRQLPLQQMSLQLAANCDLELTRTKRPASPANSTWEPTTLIWLYWPKRTVTTKPIAKRPTCADLHLGITAGIPTCLSTNTAKRILSPTLKLPANNNLSVWSPKPARCVTPSLLPLAQTLYTTDSSPTSNLKWCQIRFATPAASALSPQECSAIASSKVRVKVCSSACRQWTRTAATWQLWCSTRVVVPLITLRRIFSALPTRTTRGPLSGWLASSFMSSTQSFGLS